MRIVFERPRQPLEVGARLDEPHERHESVAGRSAYRTDVIEVELARDRDQHAVAVVFDQGAVGADAELAAQDDVKGVGQRTAGLVAELQAR